VQEVLRVGDDAEGLVRAAVLELADDELRRVDGDRSDWTEPFAALEVYAIAEIAARAALEAALRIEDT
jgi:hypothetical protein